MDCGHKSMIDRLVTATVNFPDYITKGKAYKVISERRAPNNIYDLIAVTIKDDTGCDYELNEGEFT